MVEGEAWPLGFGSSIWGRESGPSAYPVWVFFFYFIFLFLFCIIFFLFCIFFFSFSPNQLYLLDHEGLSGNTRAKNRVPPEEKEAMLGCFYAGLRLYSQEKTRTRSSHAPRHGTGDSNGANQCPLWTNNCTAYRHNR